VNAVAVIETGLGPHALLAALQAIEVRHGRVRGLERWGPRTLDLDLLVYGAWRSSDPAITVPHPRIAERAFVLWPLFELAPDLEIPGLAPVRQLVEAVPADALEAL
jgi:2-amino-4-hydroxy-6-hydroxymethyldihydropteridine diphosphokinase